MNRFWTLLIAVGTLTINWFVFFRINQWLKIADPVSFAFILVISVLVHELCHFCLLENYGIKCFMFFTVILGGVIPQSAYTEKYNNLERSKWIRVSLAGVAGNLLVIVTSCLLYFAGLMSAHNLGRTADLNAWLIVFNLLPLGIFDGGRFMKIFFGNAPSYFHVQYFRKVAIVAVAIAIVAVFFLSSETFFIFAWLFVFGLRKKEEESRCNSRNNKSMTLKEFKIWGAAYVGLIVLGIAISGFASIR